MRHKRVGYLRAYRIALVLIVLYEVSARAPSSSLLLSFRSAPAPTQAWVARGHEHEFMTMTIRPPIHHHHRYAATSTSDLVLISQDDR